MTPVTVSPMIISMPPMAMMSVVTMMASMVTTVMATVMTAVMTMAATRLGTAGRTNKEETSDERGKQEVTFHGISP